MQALRYLMIALIFLVVSCENVKEKPSQNTSTQVNPTIATTKYASLENTQSSNYIHDIKAGESLSVEYTSSGCFHYSKTLFEFNQNGVSIYEISGAKKVKLRNLKLTNTDLQALNRLFDFYEKGSDGFCTAIDTIKSKLYRNGKLVRTKEYRDNSCSMSDMRGMLTFTELMSRVEK